LKRVNGSVARLGIFVAVKPSALDTVETGMGRKPVMGLATGMMEMLERELLIADAMMGMAAVGMAMGMEVGRPVTPVMELVVRRLLIMVAVRRMVMELREVGRNVVERMAALMEERRRGG